MKQLTENLEMKQTFDAVKVCLSSKKDNVNLEGRDHVETLKSVRSWQWMTKYIRHPRLAEHTAPTLETLPLSYFTGEQGINVNVGVIPASEHRTTGQMLQTCEASRRTLMKGKVANMEVFPSL